MSAAESEPKKEGNELRDSLLIQPKVDIPQHLCGEIQSKLAYVDEAIQDALVEPRQIKLHLAFPAPRAVLSSAVLNHTEIEGKVQRVVLSMAKGGIRPKIQVLEDYLDRPVPYQADPMAELFKRGELSQEEQGIYALGPLLSRLDPGGPSLRSATHPLPRRHACCAGSSFPFYIRRRLSLRLDPIEWESLLHALREPFLRI